MSSPTSRHIICQIAYLNILWMYLHSLHCVLLFLCYTPRPSYYRLKHCTCHPQCQAVPNAKLFILTYYGCIHTPCIVRYRYIQIHTWISCHWKFYISGYNIVVVQERNIKYQGRTKYLTIGMIQYNMLQSITHILFCVDFSFCCVIK